MEFTFGFEITVECFCLNKRKTMRTLSSWPRCDLCTLDVVGLKVVSGDTDGAVTSRVWSKSPALFSSLLKLNANVLPKNTMKCLS